MKDPSVVKMAAMIVRARPVRAIHDAGETWLVFERTRATKVAFGELRDAKWKGAAIVYESISGELQVDELWLDQVGGAVEIRRRDLTRPALPF